MKSQGPNEVKPKPKLLERVRQVMRLHHYSIHTERTYIDWIKRYVHFDGMQKEEDLAEGEAKIEAFLTNLAMKGNVAAATQNQAMNALVFLYRRVLKVPLEETIDAVRAQRKAPVPVVLMPAEVGKIISPMAAYCANALWQQVANSGSGPAAGQGRGLSDETGHGALGEPNI